MGSCVSRSGAAAESESESVSVQALTAKVVDLDGSMAQFTAPVTAQEALADTANAGGVGAAPSSPRFLCCSDALDFDAPITALAAHDELRPGQLYFALPTSMLSRPLSVQDMAALAVRAATALAAAGGLSPRRDKLGRTTPAGKRRRQSTARVAPLLVAVSSKEGGSPDGGAQKNDVVHGGYAARPPVVQDGERTVRKTRKGAAGYRNGGSRHRAATVHRLSTIAEDSE